jgi:uncharacterized membrane protein YphA (DoxX/SURF4 family)
LRPSIAALQSKLGEPVDAASLGLFRIVWGVLMMHTGASRLALVDGFSAELFHATYTFFPYLRPWPEAWMLAAEAWGLIACGLAIALGVGLRWAALVYTLLYSHFFLLEKLFYNNHSYLTILVNFLLALSRADACYSVAAWRARRRRPSQTLPSVPFWNLALLRGQVCLLYFFGGLAKLNADWFQGEPIRLWLRNLKPLPPVSWVARDEWFVNFVCMSGILIDLSAGFLLLGRRTFWPTAFVLAGFHLTNLLIFPIGIFPWIGIALLLLFVEPGWPRQAAAWLRRRLSARAVPGRRFHPPPGAPASAAVTACVLAYLAIQVLVPLRVLLYSDDPGWTEAGQHFSWRMMLRYKDAYLRLDFDPPEAGKALKASGRMPRVAKGNYRKLAKVPDVILQYVHALDAQLDQLGYPDTKIRVISIAALNGRPYQLMIDPERDLTQVGSGLFEVPDWVLPLAPDQRVGQYPKSRDERRRRLQQAVDDYRREHPSLRPIRVGDD